MIRYCEECGRGKLMPSAYGAAAKPLPKSQCLTCAATTRAPAPVPNPLDVVPTEVDDIISWIDAAPTPVHRDARLRVARLVEAERPNPRKTILTLP